MTDAGVPALPGQPVRGLALILLLSAALVGCAGSAGVPAGPTSSAGPAIPADASATPSSSGAAGSWNASGASFGVDRMGWPGTVEGARTVLQAMPKELGGAAGDVSHSSGADEDPPAPSTAIVYDPFGSVEVSEEYVTTDTPSGQPEVFSANNQLSASFGLMYACAPKSYRGTAPKPSYQGGGPGVTSRPLTKSVWFSCQIAGAEGDDNFTGYAVGWTSNKTAWLVVAQDESAVRHLVTALHEAAT